MFLLLGCEKLFCFNWSVSGIFLNKLLNFKTYAFKLHTAIRFEFYQLNDNRTVNYIFIFNENKNLNQWKIFSILILKIHHFFQDNAHIENFQKHILLA